MFELHNRTTIINNAIDSSKFVFDEKKRMDKRQELELGLFCDRSCRKV